MFCIYLRLNLKRILSVDRNSMLMLIFCVYKLEQIDLFEWIVCVFVYFCLWQVFGGSCDEFGYFKFCNLGLYEGSFNWIYLEIEDLYNCLF